jgi:hypothetical protein
MPATAQQFDEEIDRPASVSWPEARAQDAYWQRNFWQERYYRVEYEYEDYAPAYCVGYAGCAQYGGSFADAERSLCANWERIKGDSRLCLEDALPAIRAAWDRMARLRQRRERPAVNDASFAPEAARSPRAGTASSEIAVAA